MDDVVKENLKLAQRILNERRLSLIIAGNRATFYE